MIAHFVEVTDGPHYGKFLVERMDPEELATPTAMPDASPGERLLTYGGRRRFNERTTLVIDLQRGFGAAWPLENGLVGFHHYATAHFERLAWWVCPLYMPFVLWLHEQGKWAEGAGDITEIPAYIDLRDGAAQ